MVVQVLELRGWARIVATLGAISVVAIEFISRGTSNMLGDLVLGRLATWGKVQSGQIANSSKLEM